MKQIFVTCPFCSKHLSLSAEAGQPQGMCPACNSIFDLSAARQQTAATAAAATSEQDAGDVRRAGLLAVLLGVLTLMAMFSWAPAHSAARGLVTGVSAAVAAGSGICALYALASMLGHKSLVPGAVTASAWGLGTGVWLVGALMSAGRMAGAEAAVTWAFYASIAVAFIIFMAALFLLMQSSGKSLYSRLPIVVLGALIAAGALGGLGAYRTTAVDYGALRAAPPAPEPDPTGQTAAAPRQRPEPRPEPQPAKPKPEEPKELRPLPDNLKAAAMIEAESAEASGGWAVERANDASEQRYMQWHGPQAAMNTPPGQHLLTYEVEIPQNGRYSVYVEVITPDQGTDSLWVRFADAKPDGSRGIQRDDGWVMVWTGTREEWGWVEAAHQDTGSADAAEFQLDKGKQTLIIGWREVGVKLDRIAVVRSKN